jgi:DNA-binding PadR family transcriptional regulator
MPLRHTLLGLLNEEPMHGYLLRKHAKTYSWIYPMTNASIYPALHGLEGDGFITHSSEIHRGRARKIYRITAEGREDLRSWLLEPVHNVPCLRDQMLLKIVMHGDHSLQDAREGIKKALEELRGDVALHESDKGADTTSTVGMELAREYGFEMLRLRVRFFEQVLALTKNRWEEAAGDYHEPRNLAASL